MFLIKLVIVNNNINAKINKLISYSYTIGNLVNFFSREPFHRFDLLHL